MSSCNSLLEEARTIVSQVESRRAREVVDRARAVAQALAVKEER